MENNVNEEAGKKAAKTIGFINIGAVVLMLLCCLNQDAAFIAFILGLVAALTNLIMMIVFITQRKISAFIICLISMLLMPIIGFGCCAAGMGPMNL